MKVVVNTTPLISLACVGRLNLFQQLFGGINLADAVYREIKAKPGYGYAEINQPWIDIRPIAGDLYRPFLLTQLDAGEAETIIPAREIHADFVVIDENRGYRLAQQTGLPVVRTLSLLLDDTDTASDDESDEDEIDAYLMPVDRLICPLAAHGGDIFNRMEI